MGRQRKVADAFENDLELPAILLQQICQAAHQDGLHHQAVETLSRAGATGLHSGVTRANISLTNPIPTPPIHPHLHGSSTNPHGHGLQRVLWEVGDMWECGGCKT